jgi:two-component system chemotaxis response regulator CheB
MVARGGGKARVAYPQRDILVIGASTGGVDALRILAKDLPSNLQAAVLVVLHIGANRDLLPAVLSAAGSLPAAHAQDGEAPRLGHWTVAPPDHHLVIRGGVLRLTQGAKEHFTRPAIDCLFRSAAGEFGPRVIGVLLTGQLDDGAAGLRKIQECGGLVMIQDPLTARAPSMPAHALKCVAADYILPLERIGSKLADLVQHGQAVRHQSGIIVTPKKGGTRWATIASRKSD